MIFRKEIKNVKHQAVSLGSNFKTLLQRKPRASAIHFMPVNIPCVGNSIPPAGRILSGRNIESTMVAYRPFCEKNVQERCRGRG